jgi:plasmid stabilization system protein ParE
VSDYVLAPDAVQDLEDIWEFIALDSPEAADRWVEKLLDSCDAIARTPAIGSNRQPT